MVTWEYQAFPAVLNDNVNNHLNAAGNAGWEIIQLVEARGWEVRPAESVYWVICKRPLNS
jgi:hypothetical protein